MLAIGYDLYDKLLLIYKTQYDKDQKSSEEND